MGRSAAPRTTVRSGGATTDGPLEVAAFVEVNPRPACPLKSVVAANSTPSIAYAPAKGIDAPVEPGASSRAFNCRWMCATPLLLASPSAAMIPICWPSATKSPRSRLGSGKTWQMRRSTSAFRMERQSSDVYPTSPLNGASSGVPPVPSSVRHRSSAYGSTPSCVAVLYPASTSHWVPAGAAILMPVACAEAGCDSTTERASDTTRARDAATTMRVGQRPDCGDGAFGKDGPPRFPRRFSMGTETTLRFNRSPGSPHNEMPRFAEASPEHSK